MISTMEALKLSSIGRMANNIDLPTSLLVLLLTSIIGLVGHHIRRPVLPKNAPQLLKSDDWPVIGAIRFWTTLGDFVTHGRQSTKTGNFSFYVGKFPVVSLTGPEGRRAFFDNKEMSLSEGYAALFTAGPGVPEEERESENSYDRWFVRTITTMSKKERFVQNLPPMLRDVQTALKKTIARVGDGGLMDPFDDLYRIVYQLTMRMVGPTEFAESQEMREKTLQMFEVIEQSVSPTRIVLQWIPTWNYLKQMYQGAKLYSALNNVVESRKKEGRRIDDTLQYLMDTGEGIVRILTYIMSSLFAGQINSGINAGWLLLFLATNPEWYNKFQEQIDGVVKKYRKTPDQSASDVLATLSLEKWESEFPIIDLGLRETIRHTMAGAAFRKNISGRDVPVGRGEVCPKDGLLIYHCDDVHMNPEVYTDPLKWDPSRFLPDRAEDKKEPLAFMGWGTGRHPCLGMRFAKLEMSIITANFISMFDFSLHDVDGRPLAEPYPVNRNATSAHKPERPMRLKVKSRNQ